MKCEKIQELAADYLSGGLLGKELEAFRGHLDACPSCRDEIGEMEQLWVNMDAVLDEEPGPGLERNFRAMLDGHSHGCAAFSGKTAEERRKIPGISWLGPSEFQAAAAVLILASGIFLGRGMEKGNLRGAEVANLRREVSQMRELVTISMLTRSSAVDRLQGVSMSREVGNPDDRLLDALIQTLGADPNVNVRLAAVDALGRYSDREWVRKALVNSLEAERSPLVQVSLIDLLTDLREPNAKEALQLLIADDETIEPVKKRAKASLEKII